MTEVSHKIDGEDFFCFDSEGEEKDNTMPSKKLFQEKKMKKNLAF